MKRTSWVDSGRVYEKSFTIMVDISTRWDIHESLSRLYVFIVNLCAIWIKKLWISQVSVTWSRLTNNHKTLCQLYEAGELLNSFTESGAVFAFGRSHLTISDDGGDNNYFFIKKDRIKKLICGRGQSGVICGNFMTRIIVNFGISSIEHETPLISFVMCHNKRRWISSFQ